MVVVTRVRRRLASVEIGRTVSYFARNEAVLTKTQPEALDTAIRGHWEIDTMHCTTVTVSRCRNVVLAEADYRRKFMVIQ